MSTLHHTAGFYPDGSYVENTVREEDLQSNIEYNETFRPGRFYFVDGAYACGGMLSEPRKTEFIRECEARIAELGMKPEPRDTRPYS